MEKFIMKKILLAILFAALIFCMCGCSRYNYQVNDYDYVDPHSGVHYLVIYVPGRYGFAMAPRYNTDGSLVIEEGN